MRSNTQRPFNLNAFRFALSNLLVERLVDLDIFRRKDARHAQSFALLRAPVVRASSATDKRMQARVVVELTQKPAGRPGPDLRNT